MELNIHYSVKNGGDGSAYPKFMESEKLARWDQDHMEEGWGEPCTGSITVKGDNLTCTNSVETKEGYLLNLLLSVSPLLDQEAEQAKEFCSEFFPDGLPLFIAGIAKDNYYGVYVGKQLVYEHWASWSWWTSYPEKKANAKGVKKLQAQLSKLKEMMEQGESQQ